MFEVYLGEIDFREGGGSKTRPAIVIELFEDDNEVGVLAVYSYRKWFENENNTSKKFVEIFDISDAGLDKRSFVDVNTEYIIAESEFSNFTHIGKFVPS